MPLVRPQELVVNMLLLEMLLHKGLGFQLLNLAPHTSEHSTPSGASGKQAAPGEAAANDADQAGGGQAASFTLRG